MRVTARSRPAQVTQTKHSHLQKAATFNERDDPEMRVQTFDRDGLELEAAPLACKQHKNTRLRLASRPKQTCLFDVRRRRSVKNRRCRSLSEIAAMGKRGGRGRCSRASLPLMHVSAGSCRVKLRLSIPQEHEGRLF